MIFLKKKSNVGVCNSGMGHCEEMSTFPVLGSRYAGALPQSVCFSLSQAGDVI